MVGARTGKSWQWTFYLCHSCTFPVVAGSIDGRGDEIEVLVPGSAEIDGAIPERARSYLEQAGETLSSPAASIMVSASAVDAMLKEIGLKDGKLYSRINKAAEEHRITPEMESWAHDVRLDANDQRHADDGAGLPSPEDAKRVYEFALAFAEYLFVLPTRVRRGRASTEG